MAVEKKPRCFANLPDISHPCGGDYFSNDMAWMKSDIMINVLTKLNNKLKHTDHQILLFLDNAPCHPASMKGMFSNIKIEFLPKNTTSHTQPLDAGIIKTWKVHYRRKLLRYIASEIDGQKSLSEIIKSVHLLTAIRWMVSAWEEVKPAVITRCFKHVGMYPDEAEAIEIDDPFAGQEELQMETLLSKISTSGHDLDMSNFDDDVDTCEPPIDTSSTTWRENLHSEIVEEIAEESDDDEASNDFDLPLKTPEVSSVKGALNLVTKLAEFSDWQGNEELRKAIAGIKDILVDSQLHSLKQSSIKNFFMKS